ncbi:hypothetical protein GCM10011607_42830 [Shewanella inventionis]|uniref:Transposase n=1 Tax=Shewanella inventionis TaxID=1738770 RepID=A0ABQ1JYS4_9GAMM|nr:hypothetical protein GCM10011607_42830 [Shewanella inventionis]
MKAVDDVLAHTLTTIKRTNLRRKKARCVSNGLSYLLGVWK